MHRGRSTSHLGISRLPQRAGVLILTRAQTARAAEVNGSREETLAESGGLGLKAIVKVKPGASMADQDWLILELHKAP